MRSTRVTLLPLGSSGWCDRIESVFSHLGYQSNSINPGELVSGARSLSVDSIIVLLLGRREMLTDKLLKFLAGCFNPTLGIVIEGDDCWDPAVLSYCKEVARWPCDDSELAFRLDRLERSTPSGLAGRDMAELKQEFLGLKLIGRSDVFQQVLAQITKMSDCDAPVLIEGETGTGKEVAARAVHYLGRRGDHPFIPVNCGAIPDSLVENELFGHAKGAFTDAKSSQSGLIHRAEGGTIFLDEIDSAAAKAQVALLRFLENQEYSPLGGQQLHKADVRVIAATHRPLWEEVACGGFREDLYFRLNILSLQMPSLKERKGDIRLLAEYFAEQFRRQYNQPHKSFEDGYLDSLESKAWPGNVRELENAIHREFLLNEQQAPASGDHQEAWDAVADRQQAVSTELNLSEAKKRFVIELERKYITRVLQQTRGNVSLAARRSGKERRAFGKLMKKHNIKKEDFRA